MNLADGEGVNFPPHSLSKITDDNRTRSQKQGSSVGTLVALCRSSLTECCKHFTSRRVSPGPAETKRQEAADIRGTGLLLL
jgi:hypothetical protein